MVQKNHPRGVIWVPRIRPCLDDSNLASAFSSNLFHGQIVQIAILRLSDQENKKCSPWKVFRIIHPQNRFAPGLLGPLLLKSHRFLEYFLQSSFQGLHFLFFGSRCWRIAIWTICPWNKFEEKAQCEYVQVATTALALLMCTPFLLKFWTKY